MAVGAGGCEPRLESARWAAAAVAGAHLPPPAVQRPALPPPRRRRSWRRSFQWRCQRCWRCIGGCSWGSASGRPRSIRPRSLRPNPLFSSTSKLTREATGHSRTQSWKERSLARVSFDVWWRRTCSLFCQHPLVTQHPVAMFPHVTRCATVPSLPACRSCLLLQGRVLWCSTRSWWSGRGCCPWPLTTWRPTALPPWLSTTSAWICFCPVRLLPAAAAASPADPAWAQSSAASCPSLAGFPSCCGTGPAEEMLPDSRPRV